MVRLPRPDAAVLVPFAVALVAVAVIGPTVMPGVGYWDTAEFQTVPPILGTMHPTGYPTYVLLGFLFNALTTPLGEPAYRMNLLSLAAVAVAAALLAHLVVRLTGRPAIGAAAGVGLAVTPIAWGIATRADAHAIHLAFVALLLVLLERWRAARDDGDQRADLWLVAAAAAFGLSAGNHSLTLLLLPSIGLYVFVADRDTFRRRGLVGRCLLAALGTLGLVYLELPLRAGPFRAPLVYGQPDSWAGFWYIALAEQFRGSIVDPFGDLGRKVVQLATFGWRQIGPLVALVPAGFLAIAVRQPALAALTGSALLVTALFNASYVNADIERYYLGPALFAWLWLGLLAGAVADALPSPSALGLRRLAVGAISVALAAGLLLPSAIDLAARSALADRSNDLGPGRWLDAALAGVEADAVVVSWWGYSTTLWYAQYVEGRRLDVLVVDDRTRLDRELGEVEDVIERYLAARPVYVMRVSAAELRPIEERYVLEPIAEGPAGNIFRVVARREASG